MSDSQFYVISFIFFPSELLKTAVEFHNKASPVFFLPNFNQDGFG